MWFFCARISFILNGRTKQFGWLQAPPQPIEVVVWKGRMVHPALFVFLIGERRSEHPKTQVPKKRNLGHPAEIRKLYSESSVFLSRKRVASIFIRKLLRAQRLSPSGRFLRRRSPVLAMIPGLTIFLSHKHGLSSTLTASKSQRQTSNRKDIECLSRTRKNHGAKPSVVFFPGTIIGRYHFHSIDARGEIAQTVHKNRIAGR